MAEHYEEIYFYVAELGRRLVAYAEPAEGARLLDVGAGRGAVARAALDQGCDVTAVDASAGMVSRLAADHPEITASQQDAGRLSFPDGVFDVVTAGFVVQVLPDPEVALAEFRRVLAGGGTVALSLERPMVGRLGWLHDLNAEFFGGGSGTPLSADRLDELLVAAGFATPERLVVDVEKPLPDPAALWTWLDSQGVPAVLDTLPAERAAEFRERLDRGAERMHAEGGIVLEFGATLHRATVS